MTDFTSITEKELLYAAWNTIVDKKLREYDRMTDHPDYPVSLSHRLYEKYTKQSQEICDRIIEIEALEQIEA